MEAAESTAGRRAPAKKRNNRAATVKRTMLAREACGERATMLVPYASLPAAMCAGKALGARPLANLHLHTPPPGSVLYLPALAGALDSMKSFLGGAATGKPLRSTKWKSSVNGATYFHSGKKPKWAKRLIFIKKIDGHYFYKEKK